MVIYYSGGNFHTKVYRRIPNAKFCPNIISQYQINVNIAQNNISQYQVSIYHKYYISIRNIKYSQSIIFTVENNTKASSNTMMGTILIYQSRVEYKTVIWCESVGGGCQSTWMSRCRVTPDIWHAPCCHAGMLSCRSTMITSPTSLHPACLL